MPQAPKLNKRQRKELTRMQGICICFGDTDPLNTHAETMVPGEILHDNPRTQTLARLHFPKYRYAMTYAIPATWRIKIVNVFDHNQGEQDLLIERELKGFGLLDDINNTALEQIQEAIDEGHSNPLNRFKCTLYYCEFISLRNTETLTQQLTQQLRQQLNEQPR